MLKWCGILVIVFVLIGCGGSEQVNNQQPTQPANNNPTPDPTPPAAENPPPKKEHPVPEAPKKPAAAVTAEWLFVLKTKNVDDKNKQKLTDAIAKKWLKDKEYQEIGHEEYDNNRAAYNGKKVIVAEVIYVYGDYEFTIRTGKIEKLDDEYIENPMDDGPEGRIIGQDSVASLIKEIRFMK